MGLAIPSKTPIRKAPKAIRPPTTQALIPPPVTFSNSVLVKLLIISPPLKL